MNLSLQERRWIDERLAVLFGSQKWTAAYGAMLFSGILPVELADEIPSSGLQIRQIPLSATPQQLNWARDILKKWREYASEGNGESECSDTFAKEFYIWCVEEFEQEGRYWRPPMFDYITTLAGSNTHANLFPLMTPAHLEKSKLVHQPAGKNILYSRQLNYAISQATQPEPYDVNELYQILISMSKNEVWHLRLAPDSGKLQYAHATQWRDLTLRQVRDYLSGVNKSRPSKR